MRSAIALTAGACLAGAGVACFLVWPSDWAYWVGTVVVGLAAGILALAPEGAPERYRRYLPSVHSWSLWTLCIVLAAAGNVAYLMSMNDRMWWAGQLAVFPLVFLLCAWLEDRRERTGVGPEYYGGTDWSGPMGPPMA